MPRATEIRELTRVRVLSFLREPEGVDGDVDMVAVITALHAEEQRRTREGRADRQIPMRPDHGQVLLDDGSRKTHPGYPLVGRLRGLAELRGVMKAVAALT